MVLLILAYLLMQVNNIYAQEDLPYRDVTLEITHDAYYDHRLWMVQGRDKFLQVGDRWTKDIYINYDITLLTELNILPQDIIHSRLHLYQEDNLTRSRLTVATFPILEEWHDQTLDSKLEVGGQISTSVIYKDLMKWYEIDTTEAVRYALNNEYDHYGFALTSPDRTTSFLWSKDCESARRLPMCLLEEKPFITVRYWINNPPVQPILLSPENKLVSELLQQEFSWEPSVDPEGEDVEYMLQWSFDREFEDIITSSQWMTKTSYSQTFPSLREYFWRVRARDGHEEHGEVVSKVNTLDISQSTSIEKSVEDLQGILSIQEEEIPRKEKIVYITQPDPIADSIGEVLGIKAIKAQIEKLTQKMSGNKCEIEFLDSKLNKQKCNISNLVIKNVSHKKIGDRYQIELAGQIDEKIQVLVESISCKQWNLFDPTTWFSSCEKAIVEKTKLDINLDTVIYPKHDSKRLTLVSHRVYKGKFEIVYESSTDLSNKTVSIHRQSFASRSVRKDRIEIVYTENIKAEIPKATITNPTLTQGLGFPFKQWVGVTQWHGNTAYQRPHTGIDFGATRKPIYSPADGYVRSAQWDSYYGKCLSGGNVLRIEHDSGKHTVYMHLADYNKSNGSKWKVGERIKKGELIGVTGNSGAYNCQTLGFHLHFEIRSSRPQSTHIDPTKQIGIDWDMVPTLGFSSYPGRLTGDNPHPGR